MSADLKVETSVAWKGVMMAVYLAVLSVNLMAVYLVVLMAD